MLRAVILRRKGIDPIDLRRRGAEAAIRLYGGDGGIFANQESLDAAVMAIPDPSAQAMLLCLALDEGAKADALDMAKNFKTRCRGHRYSRMI